MWKKLLIVSLIFGFSLAILIALSLFSFQRFDAYVSYADGIDEHHTLLKHLSNLRVQLVSLENYERGYLLFSDTSYYQNYTATQDSIRKTFSTVFQLTRDDNDLNEIVKALNFSIRSKIDLLNTSIQLGYPPGDEPKTKITMERCLGLIHQMEDIQHQRITQQLDRKEFYESSTPQNFRIVFVFAILVFCISFGLMIQQYRNRIIYQRELEKNNAELNQANAEWEQMAYVASHDLQEPLRKIRTFSDMLQAKFSEDLNEEGLVLIKRIDAASARVQSLMTDIVNYNLIVSAEEELVPVDINAILQEVMDDFKQTMNDKKVSVFIDHLPVLRGRPSQMRLLFRSLLDNSIKFSRPDEPVKISVTALTVGSKELPVSQSLSFTHYHKIIFEDNGIGFENQFADRIFRMFQRLHPQESPYEGRGIGLALVKRIMTNHMGIVVGKGRPNKGAKFILYFPVR
jgi:signal transduction histidine kinase